MNTDGERNEVECAVYQQRKTSVSIGVYQWLKRKRIRLSLGRRLPILFPMQIRSYPDNEFVCDPVIQASQTKYAILKNRLFWTCFSLMALSFAILVISGLLGATPVVWIFTAIFLLTILVSLIFSIHSTPSCKSCNYKMKRKWAARSRGPGEDLFFVCPQCKKYVDGHQSRE